MDCALGCRSGKGEKSEVFCLWIASLEYSSADVLFPRPSCCFSLNLKIALSSLPVCTTYLRLFCSLYMCERMQFSTCVKGAYRGLAQRQAQHEVAEEGLVLQEDLRALLEWGNVQDLLQSVAQPQQHVVVVLLHQLY